MTDEETRHDDAAPPRKRSAKGRTKTATIWILGPVVGFLVAVLGTEAVIAATDDPEPPPNCLGAFVEPEHGTSAPLACILPLQPDPHPLRWYQFWR